MGIPLSLAEGQKKSEYLFKHNVKFEIVPGITSAIGSAAYAGIPLTHRRFSSSVAIVTGHEDPSKNEPSVNWSELAFAVDTVVVLMGIEQSVANRRDFDKFRNEKNSTEIAIIENGTTRKQREITGNLGNIVRKVSERKNRSASNHYFRKGCFVAQKLAWFNRS